MKAYIAILPRDFINSYNDLGAGANRVVAAWRNLKEVLTEFLGSSKDDWLISLAFSLLDEMRLFEKGTDRFVALVPFAITSRRENRPDVTLALNLRYMKGDMIVVTMAATADIPALTHVLLHELLHALGFVSENEELDERAVDYLVDELVKQSEGRIAAEDSLKYTPGCSEGCGVLGAAAQFMIDKGLYVSEEDFRRNTEEYLKRGIMVKVKDSIEPKTIEAN